MKVETKLTKLLKAEAEKKKYLDAYMRAVKIASPTMHSTMFHKAIVEAEHDIQLLQDWE